MAWKQESASKNRTLMNRTFSSQKNPVAAVVLFSGFLGSGKTTLLKRILSWENNLSGTVVLVNEFGDVGIDGALLKDSGSDGMLMARRPLNALKIVLSEPDLDKPLTHHKTVMQPASINSPGPDRYPH